MYTECLKALHDTQQKTASNTGAILGGLGTGAVGAGAVYGLTGLVPELKNEKEKRILLAALGGVASFVPGALYFGKDSEETASAPEIDIEKNSMPVSFYLNRMSAEQLRKQTRDNELKDQSMPVSFYNRNGMTLRKAEEQAKRIKEVGFNSIPKEHYLNR